MIASAGSGPLGDEALSQRGLAHAGRGDIDKAIADYDKAIVRRPKFAEAYFHRANAYHDRQKFDRAIRDFSTAIGLKPDYADAYHNRAVAYGDMGDFEKAIDDYTKTIALRPGDAAPYNGRAWAHFKSGKGAEGLLDVEQALRINPQYEPAFDTRGHIYEALGRKEDAIADFRKALAINPNIPESVEGLKRLGAHAVAARRGFARLSRDPAPASPLGQSPPCNQQPSAHPGWGAQRQELLAALFLGIAVARRLVACGVGRGRRSHRVLGLRRVDRDAEQAPAAGYLLEQHVEVHLLRTGWHEAGQAQQPGFGDLRLSHQLGIEIDDGREVHLAVAQLGEDGGELGRVVGGAEAGSGEVVQDRVVAAQVGIVERQQRAADQDVEGRAVG